MSETPEQEHILNRAAVRWHSDDPIVCLQRALVECEQLERLWRERDKPPLERLAQQLERIANMMAAERLESLPESLRAERRIVDVGDGGPVERLLCECDEPDPQRVFPGEKPTHCARCSMWLR